MLSFRKFFSGGRVWGAGLPLPRWW